MLWLAQGGDRFVDDHITRFDPRFWTVNFPRPMMASITNPGGEAMDVTLVFYRKNDLAGLIWSSEDEDDHPFLAYETKRDYRGVKLRFRWQSSGIRTLPEGFGPTLTIEGRDAAGNPRAWYVRLWNYAVGTAEDAVITLDFDNLDGGFFIPSQADPVYAGDIDRLFISMVAANYDSTSSDPLTGGPVEATVNISDVRVTGGHAQLAIGDDYVKPHDVRLANGYDDSFNVTPERLIRNVLQLGYREWFVHYVGMSHYFSLAFDDGEQRFIVDPMAPALNLAARAWHRDLFTRLARYRFTLVLSLSYELFAQNAPNEWAQRAHDGAMALTGWQPPSTLLAPTNDEAMGYLERVFAAFGDLMDEAGLPLVFQIGEPWWWVSFEGPRIPHFYDAVTVAAFTTETGLSLPMKHQSAEDIPNAQQQVFLEWLGEKLGQSTQRLRDFLRARWTTAQVTLLFYTPQVLDDTAPMLKTVNFPSAHWAVPAFDFIQIEDYDHIIDGDWHAHDRALETVALELGYPAEQTHYFAGFALTPDSVYVWPNVERALGDAKSRSYAERVVWAYTQVTRDGVVVFENDGQEEDDLAGFHDIRLPEAVSFGSVGGPRFSTEVVVTASGHERRNRDWAEARAEYDISTGIRSASDIAELTAFFRARAGRAYGFRFKDWADYKSSALSAQIGPMDQQIGVGDGTNTVFQLVKYYGEQPDCHIRTITKPVLSSVRVAVAGVEQLSGWTCDDMTGEIRFDSPPALGATVSAGFEFDVPVRFSEDRLPVSLAAFEAGEAVSIQLLEIRE